MVAGLAGIGNGDWLLILSLFPSIFLDFSVYGRLPATYFAYIFKVS